MLQTATIKAFLDSVMMIIDDYREYLVFNTSLDEYRFDETAFFKMKGVYNDDVATSSLNKYQSDENEFYHEFRVTQAFEEVNIKILNINYNIFIFIFIFKLITMFI